MTFTDKTNALVMIAISAAIILTTISITDFSTLVFAQQQEGKLVAQHLPSADPISNQSSSTTSSLPDVFARVERSVVQITSTRSNPNQVIIINGVPSTGRSTALGSGFIYDTTGHIVTNYHVIGRATRADVTLTHGSIYSANVVGKDPYSDLAILQITGNSSEEKGVVPLPLANSSTVRPGDQVIAIGNPFGLSGTITTGKVRKEDCCQILILDFLYQI
jgi:S1-C subfamily serine protease